GRGLAAAGRGRHPGPWDMLWVQPESWVEIEIIGRNGLIVKGKDLVDGNEQPTGTKRFSARTFWILHPSFHDAARVSRLAGTVWRAADPERVKAFFDAYHYLMSTDHTGNREPAGASE